jgi:hypothetical protein
MISEWVNGLIVGVFGVALGSLLSLWSLLTEYNAQVPRQPGEGFWAWSKRMREEQNRRIEQAPPSAVLTSVGAAGLAGVLVGVLIWSPVDMNWAVFIPALFVGYGMLQGVLALARRRRLRVPPWFLNRVFPSERRDQTPGGPVSV